ncbi:MAG: hypothetical protein MUC49_10335 [Raineya sp.]|jgi:hypothetical protein|nr:hypothetical protein [Raineya sp.]
MNMFLKYSLLWNVCFFISSLSFGQKETFSRFTYTPPDGWKKSQTNERVTFETISGNKYCQIYLWCMSDSKGSNDVDFESDWKTLISKDIVIKGVPKKEKTIEKDWQITIGMAEASFQNQPLTVMMVTCTKGKVSFSISSNFNDNSYIEYINQFIQKVDVINDVNNNTHSTDNSNALDLNNHKTGITQSITNFDDGWTSTLTANYVQVVKNGIEVRLYYPDEAVDKNRNRGDGNPFEYHYWDIWVKPDFQTTQIFQRPKEIGMDYILDAPVTYLKSGQKGYVSLKLYFQNGVCTPIIIFTPTKDLMYQYFPNHDSFDNMLQYNKFAVTTSDIVGKWGTSGGATTYYYSSSTGQYAGSNTAATGDTFVFSKNGTYQSFHSYYTTNGGGGKQNYSGKCQTNIWTVMLSNRSKDATNEYWCQFEAVKGGRILRLMNKKYTGECYILIKQK